MTPRPKDPRSPSLSLDGQSDSALAKKPNLEESLFSSARTSSAAFLASSFVRVTVSGAFIEPLYMKRMWLAVTFSGPATAEGGEDGVVEAWGAAPPAGGGGGGAALDA